MSAAPAHVQAAPSAQAPKIHWPSPPQAGYPTEDQHAPPLPCVLHQAQGRITRGFLLRLDLATGAARFSFPGQDGQVRLRFSEFLSLTLTQPLAPAQPQRIANQADALLQRRTRIAYRLEIKDDKELTGQTVGYIEESAGLFLFPPIDDGDRLLRMFVPKQAIVRQELGDPIGKLLVEQQAATSDQVEQVAAIQEKMRAQKIGDMLVQNRIVTPDELLAALQMQQRMPMLRVGEALIAMNLIRQEQLDAMLALQKNDRSKPLGELLVQHKMISRQDLHAALARKMGYPMVDLARFPFEAAALQRVPYAVAQRLKVLPLALNDTLLAVAIEDITRRAALDEIEFLTQLKVMPALASQEEIESQMRAAYARIGRSAPAMAETDEPSTDGEAPGVAKLAENLERTSADDAAAADEPAIEQSDNSLVRLINQMIIEADAEGVSDIHIECSPGREKVKVRFRRDGQLRTYIELPHTYRGALVSRIKVMCDLDISERRKPQDGKINFARFSSQHKLELRVVTIPTVQGLEDVVMRLLASAKPLALSDLALSPLNLTRFRSTIERPYGLVLCVGPTGSGKTTTLHSALGHLNRPERKIWTAEDPVEITQAGLRQMQVNAKIGLTFAQALRSFLRADPDVIMVGEARDQETAHMLVEASLTGHLVLSTLHTNSAPETVTRLADMGVDVFNLADALLGVLAQRLLRRVCANCRTQHAATTDEIDELLTDYVKCAPDAVLTRDAVLADWNERFAQGGALQRYHSAGCDKCGGSGLRGRIGIHELMTNDRELRRLIQTGAAPIQLQECAMRTGMRTLRQDGIEKVLMGLTTIEEVRATSNE